MQEIKTNPTVRHTTPLQLLAAFAATVAVLFVLLLGACALPAQPVLEHVYDSAQTIQQEGLYPEYFGFKLFQMDNYTDTIMLFEAAAMGEQNPLTAMMTATAYNVDNFETMAGDLAVYCERTIPLVTGAQKAVQLVPFSYARYWHGYLIWLRPLLCVMSITGVRVVQYLVLFALLAVILWQLRRQCGLRAMVWFAVSQLAVTVFWVPHQVQYFTTFCIAYAGCAWVLARPRRAGQLSIALVVLGVSAWSGLFFVRSIVRPLGEIEATATKIAKGDLQVRLPDNRYNDEVGRLCKTINQMAEDLAETDRLKNEFISSVSHELRTPLTSIKGWVETIGNIDDPTDKNYQRGLSVIGTETDRLYTMVEELLDFSRLQNGIKLNCQVLDLVAEATDAALFVEARIRQEGLHFVYEEPPDPYPVWADPARLHQVFINILDNAIKYSEPDGTIFLTLTRRGDSVTAAVRDQGRGIAPDDLEKVKQKFFKAKNSVRGSGIGLAVVDEIITALGGRVDIASTLGQGTTVSITLPVYHPGQEHLHEKI